MAGGRRIQLNVSVGPFNRRGRPSASTSGNGQGARREIVTTGRTCVMCCSAKHPALFQKVETHQALNQNLNDSQNQAVAFALSADDVAIIHGPPGTGKTTTLVELMRQITRNGQSVLAVAASNLAVDNMLERLLDAGENAIRLGHPARVSPELREHTLDLLVENHPDAKFARKLTRDAHALKDQSFKYTRAKPEPGAREAIRQEAKDMLREARKIEEGVIERVLSAARIVCATSTGLDDEILNGRIFDWCIMDEASQSTEPAAWIPLQYANRLVLAGDHFQLPPTVISTEAAKEGFDISLMERLLSTIGTKISRRLDVQYRMHSDIMTFSSDVFYENSLQADESVRTALLADLPGGDILPADNLPRGLHRHRRRKLRRRAGTRWRQPLQPTRSGIGRQKSECIDRGWRMPEHDRRHQPLLGASALAA